MYRFGEKENHSYVKYAGFSKSKAIQAGKAEQDYRGQKYSPEVVEFISDDSKNTKIVLKLNQEVEKVKL